MKKHTALKRITGKMRIGLAFSPVWAKYL